MNYVTFLIVRHICRNTSCSDRKMLLLPGVKDGVVIASPTLVLLQIETQFDF